MLAAPGKVSVAAISNSKASCFSLFRINRLVQAKGHSTDTEPTPSQLSMTCQNAQTSLKHSKSAHK